MYGVPDYSQKLRGYRIIHRKFRVVSDSLTKKTKTSYQPKWGLLNATLVSTSMCHDVVQHYMLSVLLWPLLLENIKTVNKTSKLFVILYCFIVCLFIISKGVWCCLDIQLFLRLWSFRDANRSNFYYISVIK